jgi:hypothetical protein
LFLVISFLQFFVYESSQNAVEQLIATGTPPLVALAYVTVAVSVGSPILLISAVRYGLDPTGLGLVVLSLFNSVAVILMGRNVGSLLLERWRA